METCSIRLRYVFDRIVPSRTDMVDRDYVVGGGGTPLEFSFFLVISAYRTVFYDLTNERTFLLSTPFVPEFINLLWLCFVLKTSVRSKRERERENIL